MDESRARRVAVDDALALPRDATIAAAFAVVAAGAPDAVALVAGDARVSYRELERRSAAWAERLRAAAVAPGERVGILLERSVDAVVAILAVARAGAAWVPLDPELPAARLSFILADADIAVVVTRRGLAGTVDRPVTRLLFMDDWADSSGVDDRSFATPALLPDHPAYIIYTSGSTGQPKGAVLTQEGVVNMALAHAQRLDIGPGKRILQFFSFSFDASIFELFVPLLTGATAVMPPRDVLMSPGGLAEVLRRERVTSIQLPPDVLATLPDGEYPALETVLIGGQIYPAELVARWAGRHRVINFYGPTEATVSATCFARGPDDRGSIIGRPLANVRVYVLDGEQHAVATGVAGELYIGGRGVGLGYLNRPELTAERFLRDPFVGDGAARMYRTGDRARYLADGNIEFLGRVDTQVKVRGFRVELEEVEAALGRCRGVKAAAAAVQAGAGGHEELVGFVVAGGPLDAAALRAELSRSCPHYMVPSRLVALDELPRTPNGKIDRGALARVAGRALVPERARVAPASATEHALAEVVGALLGVPSPSLGDSFLELGGHSLVAVQAIARLRERLGVEVPLSQFLGAGSLGELAARLDERRHDGGRGDGQAGRGQDIDAGPSAAPGAATRLSSRQAALWHLQQTRPDSVAYNTPFAFRLLGELDRPALGRALAACVARHAPLHTRIVDDDGRPRAEPAAGVASALDLIDLGAHPAARRLDEALALGQAMARCPFDLARELPLRATLARLSPREHVLLVVVHHIAADGWSFGILLRELSTLYRAFSTGAAAALPPLPADDGDAGEAARAEAAVAFFREYLAGAPPLTRLPFDRPRPAAPSERGGRVPFALDARQVAALGDLARSAQSSLFMTLAGALALLLARHGAGDDVVLGTVLANRERRTDEERIGYFASALPLRIDVAGDATFTEVLTRARAATLAALDHRQLAFDALVQALKPARHAGTTPIFQVMLVLQSFTVPPLALPDIESIPLAIYNETAKYDLVWELNPTPDGGLAGHVEYRADVFDRGTAAALAARLVRLVEAMIADPGAVATRVPLLDDAERARLLAAGRPRQRFLPGPCLHELFAAQVRRAPARAAVSFAGETLSYADLDARAAAIADRLGALGLATPARVALCVDRTPALVAGVLGILAAGGAYVPIDPHYPQERCDFMLADCGAAWVVAEERFAERFRAPGRAVITVDAHGRCRDADGSDASNSDGRGGARRPISPHDIAYIIYTSGTTGRPKGMQITHHNVGRLLRCGEALFGFDPDDVWTLFHSYAFDFSVWEMWGALAYGGTLVIVPHAVSRDPEAFLRLLERERVTALCQTPSAFTQLIQAEGERAEPARLALRHVYFGGEALHFRSLEPWIARHGDAAPRLINMYGITETTVHVTARRVTAADVAAGGSLIGAPLADLGLYLVDGHGQLVPDGVPGEIWVGGDGVGAGYLDRPELDARRFPLDPFAHDGRRIYRSGDVARRRRDGEVEYLGRLDNQVKVRGFRVELEEIEACLGGHPAVREAVVAVRDEGSDPELVAWLLTAGNAAQAVREHARQRLPEHMVPSRIIELDAFPLTPAGKTDRRALPMAASAARVVPGERAAPASALERQIAAVWQDVLGIERVGRDESFFDVGGHSLLATKVVLRLRTALGVAVPVRALLEAPTVAGMAARVAALGGEHDDLAAIDPDRLLREAALDDDIRPARTVALDTAPRRILLTGATGFLGGHLLYELLRGGTDVYCLVRCRDAAAGHARLVHNLAGYGLDGDGHAARIHAVPGDLGQPRFGLSPERFDALAAEVDAVYHSGAWVNFLEGYDRLRPANVAGTAEALRLACRAAIPLHYISTTGVFGTPGYRQPIDTLYEHDDLRIGLGAGHIGYVQAKWVAEQLVWAAHARGLPVTVFRCGLVMGHSRTGHTNVRDFPSMMIKGCLQLGATYVLDKVDNFIPVDIASRAIVHISRQPESYGRPFHVVNPQHVRFTEFWDLIRACGHVAEALPYARWVERFLRQPGGAEANALHPVFSLFLERVPAAGRTVIELFEGQPRFDATQFQRALAGSDIRCPPIDQRLVATWMAYYRQCGFLSGAAENTGVMHASL